MVNVNQQTVLKLKEILVHFQDLYLVEEGNNIHLKCGEQTLDICFHHQNFHLWEKSKL